MLVLSWFGPLTSDVGSLYSFKKILFPITFLQDKPGMSIHIENPRHQYI